MKLFLTVLSTIVFAGCMTKEQPLVENDSPTRIIFFSSTTNEPVLTFEGICFKNQWFKGMLVINCKSGISSFDPHYVTMTNDLSIKTESLSVEYFEGNPYNYHIIYKP